MIVPFITTPYVSRVLGPAGVGEYSYAGSIVSYFVLVASLGIATFGQREIAYSQDNVLERSRAFWEAVILKSFTSLSALAAYIGFLIITNETRIVFYILLSIHSATFFEALPSSQKP
jgi:O-antigen/teichoic acid export membrane protein